MEPQNNMPGNTAIMPYSNTFSTQPNSSMPSQGWTPPVANKPQCPIAIYILSSCLEGMRNPMLSGNICQGLNIRDPNMGIADITNAISMLK